VSESESDLQRFPLRAESYECEPREFECTARCFGPSARLRRAGLMAGGLGLGAVLSLPIPGWHLLAVPGLLAGAVYMGARRWRQEFAIEAIAGPCPACGAQQQLQIPAAAQFPHTLACPGCQAFLKLSRVR